MGKRSNFPRRKQDAYDTPPEAVLPLLPWLKPQTRFCEPCAGKGDLLDELVRHGHVCARARDIEPRREDIEQKDALTTITGNIDCFITNPPWTREILHPLIEFLARQHPTWLLFDADWMHTKQAAPWLKMCEQIVSVGRVSWMQNGTSGKDNCAWYLFEHPGRASRYPRFIGREAV